MAKYVFLSDEWFAAVRTIQAEHRDVVPAEMDITMNLTITETPFAADRTMHMVTAGGQADWGEGHRAESDVALTLAYSTAKDIFVGGNPQAAIEAFLSGRIILQGDLTKLMAIQAAQPTPGAPLLAQALLDITE